MDAFRILDLVLAPIGIWSLQMFSIVLFGAYKAGFVLTVEIKRVS